ncbi:single-stranded DNA-binding protein [Micromonospora sp. WMMD812]|uniref:single-stranded DNA-binding protein n=1 Tax=Micromonospora sp. WMMD812 TaxID=3015152 RepID=UPI00248C5E35|nr:single-stranded DNA-binding protein [Micromonospora sp. WMMD812]WBB66824.1 single-stranded DNA-binding protein [Micromonospora sp. WMMD812]
MFDTYVTIVGNILTAPEWRRTTQSNTLVANFKVASTARRLDRDSGRWVDGNSLRVRVNCWRKLAEGVAASVMVGDPVVVCGRLYTRDWTDDAGNHRTLYELEAVAVGHDLSRGRARFLRNRPSMATSAVEDAEAESRVHGEQTEPVPDGQAPALPDRRSLDDDFDLPDFSGPRAGRAVPSAAPFVGAAGPVDPFAGAGSHDEAPFGAASGDDEDPFARAVGEEDSFARAVGDEGSSARAGADDEGPDEAGEPAGGDEVAPLPGEPEGDGELDPVPGPGAPAGRGRRGRGRVPQPA